MNALVLAADATTSPASNAGLQTLILGVIMLAGTALLMWLIARFDGPR